MDATFSAMYEADIKGGLRLLLLVLIVPGRPDARAGKVVWHAMAAALGVVVRVSPAARPG